MANIDKNDTGTQVVTGVCRLSYAHVWEAAAINGGKEKFSVSVLVPKSDKATIAKINAAIKSAYIAGESKLKAGYKTVPPLGSLKTPLRDGDEERGDDPAYVGHYFLNCSSDTAPGIVDLNRRKVSDRSLVYSGCYARVSLNMFAFNASGNRGIAAGLSNIQLVRDGEPLGGRSRAEDDFDDDFSSEFAETQGDDDFLS
jgi:hypothetical protein